MSGKCKQLPLLLREMYTVGPVLRLNKESNYMYGGSSYILEEKLYSMVQNVEYNKRNGRREVVSIAVKYALFQAAVYMYVCSLRLPIHFLLVIV